MSQWTIMMITYSFTQKHEIFDFLKMTDMSLISYFAQFIGQNKQF